MHLVRLNSVPIFQQLELEEAILRAGTGEWLIVNTGAPPAIVMGISGKPEELVEPHSTLPMIKRFSGGGCVVIDEETVFVTMIGDMESPNPCKIHCHAETHLKKALFNLPFALKQNDYILDDKKFGGNAQYITKNRFLHHTSLLWDYNPERMSLLKNPKKQPEYRQNRPHHDFLTSLHPHFPSKEDFILQLLSYFLKQPDPIVPAPEDLGKILSQPHRRSLKYVSLPELA
ncbi:MAG: lipoate--protein ligase family protein [Chlamydiia bacterium]|nr:lipoate--protein ligase family protein [Chlamydiia bacterium]